MQVTKEYSDIKVTLSEEDLYKKGVIYLLEFPNGKVYIGQTVNDFKKRLNRHCGTVSGCAKLRNAILKYNEFKAYVLSSNLTTDQMNLFETFFIKAYNSFGKDGYNLTSGGDSYIRDKSCVEKRKATINNWTDDEKKAYSEKQKVAQTGKKASKETIEKKSKALKGRYMQKIKSLPDNKIFDSVTECEEFYGIKFRRLSKYYGGKVHKKSGQTFVKIGGRYD